MSEDLELASRDESSQRLLDVEQQLVDPLDLPTFSEKPTRVRRSTSFLDGLRGVAALCVFTQHWLGGDEHNHGFGESDNWHLISLPFLRVFYSGGGAAVAVFFVLSGFVLSQSSIKLAHRGNKQGCKESLLSAAVRRIFRLYLPCFAVAFCVAMAMHLPFNIYPPLPWSQGQETVWAEIAHWADVTLTYFNPFQHHGWVFGQYEYILPIWTIPIELKGSALIYVLCAVVCFIVRSAEHSVVLLAITTVTLFQVGWWTVGCFCAGLILTLVDVYDLDASFLRRLARFRSAFTHITFIAAWYLLSQPTSDGHPQWSYDTFGWHYLTSMIPDTYDTQSYYRFWESYGALLLIWAILRISWLQAVFNTRPLQYLGKVSFMLYVVHEPVLLAAGGRLKRLLGGTDWWDNEADKRSYDGLLYIPDIGPLGLSTRYVASWVIMLSLVLSIAHVATRFIDDPCVRLGKWVSRSVGLP